MNCNHPNTPRPYQAQVSRGGNRVNIGTFATAEEAALSIARFPRLEREKIAGRAEAQPHVTSDVDGGGGDDAGEDEAPPPEEEQDEQRDAGNPTPNPTPNPNPTPAPNS